MNEENGLKIGDKLIANDGFYEYIEGKVIEITPYNNSIKVVNVPNTIEYGVTILAKIKGYDDFGGEHIRSRELETCSFKINPTNTDVNIDWTCYGTYCKAIFFTSEEEKKRFNDNKRKDSMNYHLNKAKFYGYRGE